MKVYIVSERSMNGSPLAVYTDRMHAEAVRVAKLIGGFVEGPLEANRDIPQDATTMFHVEFTRDGKVRKCTPISVLGVLKMAVAGQSVHPSWTVLETKKRWRLNVHLWSADQEQAIEDARAVFRDVAAGKRQKSGVL